MTTQQMLDEAIAARHRLVTGAQMVSFTGPGGRSMTFTATTLAQLDSYIASLRAQVAGTTSTRRNRITYAVPI